MTINWTSIAATVESIASTVQSLAPLASAAGPEGALIGAIVSKGAGYVASVAAAAAGEAGALGAIGSDDLATVQAADATLQADNIVQALLVAAS